MTVNDELIKFDPTDLEEMRRLMQTHGESKTVYPGVNDDGERVTISIGHDRIEVCTYQDNDWRRINTYWADGTREETYTK